MKILIIIIIAALAFSISFLFHILTVEWLPQWVSSQMQGIETALHRKSSPVRLLGLGIQYQKASDIEQIDLGF